MREPGQAIGRDIANGDKADSQLDAFISRRHEQRLKSEPGREAEAAWVAAEKLQEAARRRENLAGWYGWHMHRAELHARLSAEHAATAEGLMEETGERRTA